MRKNYEINIISNENFLQKDNFGGSIMNNKALHNENEETREVVLEQSCKQEYIMKRIIVTDDYVEFEGFPLSEGISEISIYKPVTPNKIVVNLGKKEKENYCNYKLVDKRLNREDDELRYLELVLLLYSIEKKKEFSFIEIDGAYYLD